MGDARAVLLDEVGGCVVGEGGDEAVDAFVEEVVGVGGLFGHCFGGVANDEIVARLVCDLFDAGEGGNDEFAVELVEAEMPRILAMS